MRLSKNIFLSFGFFIVYGVSGQSVLPGITQVIPPGSTWFVQALNPSFQKQDGGLMSKSRSRIPAPKVAPVIIKGIRYEQVKNGLLAGQDQMGGYLAAYDIDHNKQLWLLKVYDNKRNPEREGDVQDIFFKSMTLQDDGSLLIVNERKAAFIVDVERKTVTSNHRPK